MMDCWDTGVSGEEGDPALGRTGDGGGVREGRTAGAAVDILGIDVTELVEGRACSDAGGSGGGVGEVGGGGTEVGTLETLSFFGIGLVEAGLCDFLESVDVGWLGGVFVPGSWRVVLLDEGADGVGWDCFAFFEGGPRLVLVGAGREAVLEVVGGRGLVNGAGMELVRDWIQVERYVNE